jgi:hypothetical protein
MRTEKELFELMLTRQDLFKYGMCDWVDRIYVNDCITVKECDLMHNYFKSNKLNERIFWWASREIEPRIEWIKQQIEKL